MRVLRFDCQRAGRASRQIKTSLLSLLSQAQEHFMLLEAWSTSARRRDPRQDSTCILCAMPRWRFVEESLFISFCCCLLLLPLLDVCLVSSIVFLAPISALSCFFSFGLPNKVAVCLCHGWDPRQLRLHEDLLLHAQRSSAKHAPSTIGSVIVILDLPWEEISKNFCCEVRNHTSVASASYPTQVCSPR